jgi:WD40 repeat protein
VAIGLGALTLAWMRDRRLRDNATLAAEEARAGRRSDSFVVAQAFADKAAALAAEDVQLSAAVYAAAVVDKIPESDSRPQARALRLDAQSQILAARLGLIQGIESDRDAGGAVTAMASAPRSIATASGHTVKLWRDKGEPAGGLTGHADDVVAIALSSNGAVLASADRAGAIKVWDTASRRASQDLRTGGVAPADLAVAPVATGLVAAAERGGAVTLFALGTANGTAARTIAAHRADATAVAFAPDGELLASGARDGTLALWNPASGAQVGKLGGHSAAVLDLVFAPDGHLLASAAADGSVRLWSPTERTLVAGLAGHRAAVTSLAFSPDGAMLYAAASDGSVRAWFVADGQPALAVDGHERGTTFAAVTSAGLVVTAGADGHLRTWRLGGARTLPVPAELTGAIAFSPDGAVVAAAAVDHRVHRFRIETGQPLPALTGHTAEVGDVAFSPDGSLIATASDDGSARLWRVADGQPLSSLVGHKGPVEAVAFSPGGVVVATAGEDHTVRLWSSQGAQTLGVLAEHKDRVVDVAISPDGKRLAAVGWDGLLQLWTMQQKGAVPERAVPGKGRWFSVDFSPDSTSVVAAGERGVILFRAADGSEIATIEGPASSAVEARFTPDGKMIASASADGSVHVHLVAGARPVLSIPADPPLVAVSSGVDGTLLAWGDGPRVRLAPLDLSLLKRPAAEVRRDAETAAGLELRGFALLHR